jgi:hypothetical protein
MSLISLSSSQNVNTYGYVIFLNLLCFQQTIFRKFKNFKNKITTAESETLLQYCCFIGSIEDNDFFAEIFFLGKILGFLEFSFFVLQI